MKTQNKIVRQFLQDFHQNESIITVKLGIKNLTATSNDAVKEKSKQLQLYQKFWIWKSHENESFINFLLLRIWNKAFKWVNFWIHNEFW